MSRTKMIAVLTAIMLGMACNPLWAQIVKWVDEKGETHYGDKIPPEYAGKANKRLDNSGVTRQVNEGQLTPEQMRARDAVNKKAEDENQKRLEVQRRNKALLTTYSSLQEIDIAREKSLRQAEDTIRGIQQKITDTQALQVQLQKEADGYKGSKKIPNDLKESIDGAEKDLRTNQLLVVAKRKELDSIRGKFAEERQTYMDLTGATDATAPAPAPAAAVKPK